MIFHDNNFKSGDNTVNDDTSTIRAERTCNTTQLLRSSAICDNNSRLVTGKERGPLGRRGIQHNRSAFLALTLNRYSIDWFRRLSRNTPNRAWSSRMWSILHRGPVVPKGILLSFSPKVGSYEGEVFLLAPEKSELTNICDYRACVGEAGASISGENLYCQSDKVPWGRLKTMGDCPYRKSRSWILGRDYFVWMIL